MASRCRSPADFAGRVSVRAGGFSVRCIPRRSECLRRAAWRTRVVRPRLPSPRSGVWLRCHQPQCHQLLFELNSCITYRKAECNSVAWKLFSRKSFPRRQAHRGLCHCELSRPGSQFGFRYRDAPRCRAPACASLNENVIRSGASTAHPTTSRSGSPYLPRSADGGDATGRLRVCAAAAPSRRAGNGSRWHRPVPILP
jgi:hypothetical protein